MRLVLPVDAIAESSRLEEPWKSLSGRPIDQLVREDVPMSSAPITAETLRGLGFDVHLVTERELELAPDRLLFVAGNPRAYKGTLGRLASTDPAKRPTTIVWHTEPLPMPRAAGLRRELLTTRELAKIALRDRRINDHYSNARYLKGLARRMSSTHSPSRPTRTRRTSRSRAWTSRSSRSGTIPPSGRLSTASATSTCSSSATSGSGDAGGSCAA